ncbi:MAG: metalloregulator ArsR/SmtB family transcription factor [Gammaproteobacteria bacterium]|nr:metalloregulator ArsR/SmtB family transcription factor [Gammaproteobacteria bacterium]
MSNYRTIDLDRHAGIFKALSSPHRLHIFTMLAGCCEPGTRCSTDEAMNYCVGDLSSRLNIAASTLSHHLKELHRAGLIEMQRQGKQIFCSINPSTLAEVSALFASASQTPTYNTEDPHGS